MTWFKVDDKLHDHRKSRAAGATAMGVWLLAGSWSADNLTDGFIPAAILPRWGRPRDAARLVEVGLWHTDEQDGEKGWRFHEWEERQPTRAQKLAERELKAQAGRSGGLNSGRSRREAAAKQSASHDAGSLVEPPTRPDPTIKKLPSSSADAETDRDFLSWYAAYPRKAGKGAAAKAYRAARRKPGVTAEMLLAAVAAQREALTARGTEFIPHPSTWLNAERWADELDTPTRNGSTRHIPHASELEQPPDDLTPEQYREWHAEQRARRAQRQQA